MIAACDLKYAARVGENAFLDILDPGPVHAHRHLILGFTRHRAGVTSDALAVIDYEAVFHPRGLDPKTQTNHTWVGTETGGHVVGVKRLLTAIKLSS
jgi:hypothetical protein